jgi:anti-sigma factor RsiW
MSQATEHSDTPSSCDSLLDYVYGELEGEALEQFKLHLLGCDKCKRELAGLERVRSAVKQAMPPLDPPVDKMAAMHAQLMHAAAQQKPKRGKVLMFARRMVSHPAYAAAAVFALVATTLTVNWSMGKLAMPAAEPAHEEVTVAEPAAAPPAPAPIGLLRATEKKSEKALDETAKMPADKPAEEPTKTFEGFAKDRAKPEPKIVLKTDPAQSYTVRTPPAKPAKEQSRSDADDLVLQPVGGARGKGGGATSGELDGIAKGDTVSRDEGGRAQRRHAASDLEAKLNTQDYKKAPAPASRPGVATGAASTAPQRESQVMAQNQAAGPSNNVAQAPAAAAPPPPPPQAAPALTADPKPQTKSSNSYGGFADNNLGNKQQQAQPDPALLKKQFLAYVSSGRCADAVTTFQSLERQHVTVTMAERIKYADCLRQVGQNERAESELANVEQEKRTNAVRATKKAKSKSNASDQQQNAAPSEKAADKSAY